MASAVSAAPPAKKPRTKTTTTTTTATTTAATETTPAPATMPAPTTETPTTTAPAPVAETPSAAPARAVLRVVVTELDRSEDLSERTGRIVADNLVAELRKLGGLSVVSMDEVRAMLELESERQLLGCSDESSSCLSEIADALGADVVVSGRIATLDGARVFSLRRLDQRRAAVTGQVEERLVAAGGEEFLAAIGPAIEKLFPDMPLKVGASRGVPRERARLLNPPPLPVWSTIAVGGASVAILVGSAGALVAANAALGSGQKLVDRSRETPIDGLLVVEQEQTAQTFSALGVGLAVGGVVVGAGAGVMALFTDWDNAAAAAE
jgi:hypothetical protein